MIRFAAVSLVVLGLGQPALVSAQQVPTPSSVFGFNVGADSQLFTYDQSIEYFRRLAASSPYVRLVEVGKTSFGKPWTIALISSPANLARIDEFRRINQRIARPEGLTDAQARTLAHQGIPLVDISGGPARVRDRGFAAHAATRVRVTLSRRGTQHKGDPRQHHPVSVAEYQPGWSGHRGELVPRVARWSQSTTDGGVPEVRRSRQQPRQLHAERGGIARDRTDVARVGAADHLRAPPVLAVPDTHLDSAIRGPDRPLRTADHVAHSELDRHAHRAGAGPGGQARRCAHARDVRRLLPGLHRLHADVPAHRVVVDGNAGRQLRHHAHVDRGPAPSRVSHTAADVDVQQPMEGGALDAEGPGRLHGHRVDRHASLCGEVPRGGPVQPVPVGS